VDRRTDGQAYKHDEANSRFSKLRERALKFTEFSEIKYNL